MKDKATHIDLEFSSSSLIRLMPTKSHIMFGYFVIECNGVAHYMVKGKLRFTLILNGITHRLITAADLFMIRNIKR